VSPKRNERFENSLRACSATLPTENRPKTLPSRLFPRLNSPAGLILIEIMSAAPAGCRYAVLRESVRREESFSDDDPAEPDTATPVVLDEVASFNKGTAIGVVFALVCSRVSDAGPPHRLPKTLPDR
jgi:hypothetical protein